MAPIRFAALAAVSSFGLVLLQLEALMMVGANHCVGADCDDNWFPLVFAAIDALFVMSLVCGVVALVGAVRSRATMAAIGVLAAAGFTTIVSALKFRRPGPFGTGDLASMGQPWRQDGYVSTVLGAVVLTAGFVLAVVLLSRGARSASGRGHHRSGNRSLVLTWIAAGSGLGAGLTALYVMRVVMIDLLDSSNDCDYPDDCITRYFPTVYEQTDRLWLVVLVLGAVALAARALDRASRESVLMLAAAEVLAAAAWILSRGQNWGTVRPGEGGSI